MNRYSNLHHIQKLDPARDHCEIYRLMTGYEFPWEMNRAFEIALLRTFCSPRIASLLEQTGQFHLYTQKRYDDTSIIVAELARWGYDSDRGREVLRRMNRMHQRFEIANEDFLYVLSTIVCEPIRWNDRFGWRKMCEQEKLASFYFWRELGQRMGIQNIPETYEALEAFNRGYEAQNLQPTVATKQLGQATRNLILSWFPRCLQPLMQSGFYACLDSALIQAFQFPQPSPLLRGMVTALFKLRRVLMPLLPHRRHEAFLTNAPHLTYPEGYRLAELGPSDLLSDLNQEQLTEDSGRKLSRCPFKRLMNRLGTSA